MSVDGAEYFLLLALTALLCFASPAVWRRWILLCSSLSFYFLSGAPVAFLLVPLALSYFSARLIENLPMGRKRQACLWLAVTLIAAPLVLFKIRNAGRAESETIPLGLSFFTLQLIGYVFDVAYRKIPAERRADVFALFGSFFPVVTAGPIERSTNLFPQLRALPGFDRNRVRAGFLLVIVGLIKKAVLANALSPVVTGLFKNPAHFSGGELLAGTWLARYQLYCDFSSYSDIAIGSALILGVVLRPNFDRPFAARSIADFWRRWHISLSTWMRDYVFFPLAGTAGVNVGVNACLITTFLVLGLWHGFTWNFAIYGILQGVLLVFHRSTETWRVRLRTKAGLREDSPVLVAGQIAFTLLFFASLPMVLFVTATPAEAISILQRIFSNSNWLDFSGLGSLVNDGLKIVVLVAAFEIASFANARKALGPAVSRQPLVVRWMIYLSLILIFAAFGRFDLPIDFAYRNF